MGARGGSTAGAVPSSVRRRGTGVWRTDRPGSDPAVGSPAKLTRGGPAHQTGPHEFSSWSDRSWLVITVHSRLPAPVRDGLVFALAYAAEMLFWGGDARLRWGGALPPAVVFVGTAVVYAVLFVRRAHSVRVFVVVWIFTVGAAVALPRMEPFVALLVMLFTVAQRRPGETARLALGASAVPVTIDAYNAYALSSGAPARFVFPLAIWIVVALAVWSVGRSAHRAHERARHSEAALAEAAARATAVERARVARELHDILTHSVSAMILQAAGARALAGRAPADQTTDARVVAALRTIEDAGTQAMRELHRLLGLLRTQDGDLPDEGTDVGDRPSIGRLDGLIESTRDSGQVVAVSTVGSPVALDPSVDLAAYRVVQESLSNAMRHAGRDGRVDVGIEWHPQRLDLRIRSAPGFPGELPAGSGGLGLGLLGLQERVELVGGRFQAGPVDGDFLTSASFPLQPSGRAGASLPEVG